MPRESIPKGLKEKILDEYDHRCAVCGGDRPHLHHIDEDATNNIEKNLLPLCPNCHLRDQHNPTRKVDIPKLNLFRNFKDPSILRPQFHPIYVRQRFLDDVEVNVEPVQDLERKSNELIEFVASLEMGDFYSKRIKELIGRPNRAFVYSFGGGRDAAFERLMSRARKDYRQQLFDNNQYVKELLIELLRYQGWANS
ncbi:MAG: HNH endonuclease signature motif containing protein [Alcanivorax sp.]|uniref:HNH endonuclease n=1 Tax=Alloalcanivorax marinus TaxID=1177169 RepID=A0A9Q3UQT6_9GAMM|nr:HNH endonuclease signature motif containing protein [Alloalcanivorax marinus]MCC4309757.1 HNH endonuclease [Alloalcanivorax marinus]